MESIELFTVCTLFITLHNSFFSIGKYFFSKKRYVYYQVGFFSLKKDRKTNEWFLYYDMLWVNPQGEVCSVGWHKLTQDEFLDFYPELKKLNAV